MKQLASASRLPVSCKYKIIIVSDAFNTLISRFQSLPQVAN
jgi:hypothetical protein